MKAYIYDDKPGDQRLPHDTGIDIPEPTLAKLGVTYQRIPIDPEGAWESKIDEFAKERGYKNRDRITVTREGLGEAYEEKIKSFFDEHLHEDEEIRYILAGSGYFDIRGAEGVHEEQWIRIALEAGDLIVLPAGYVRLLPSLISFPPPPFYPSRDSYADLILPPTPTKQHLPPFHSRLCKHHNSHATLPG
ncbi:1,2-dihydroxy-3-keto-5-methylthiopentene dioxygenase 1 [Cryptococcus neoformans c8]|nr:1,2-dihydroxy-3-keto-5-methylthiopentene dioxygenase 1 [Cryptococcus neoformans var. grubii AD1-83a]OXG65673.1 1,2-dihydroxy-3-keto-5-methylthiopentene dioxygenase 1 [Cryptococcus neoformans var. grubii c8]OXG67374.1 1,2-dihydroxy-3-keto-5-methylthiopentene dioxygenase 1 [Cryptococcus neoformans var. grubii CHC193]OXH14392.1 1,2-dihydroxy-3-keto-5-methylthiopentene dioxygenase 1 [Cryptococcus neoformans var. grubii A1-35-8]